MTKGALFRLLQSSSVLLFIFQSLRVIFSVLFGIIYDGIFEGPFTPWLVISNVLIIVAFISPAFLGKRTTSASLMILASVAGIARVTLSINVAIIRYWGSLVVIIAGLIYLVVLLRQYRAYVFSSVVLAMVLDQLLKVLGTTVDISLRTWWLPVQVLWALGLIWVSLRLREGASQENTGYVNLGIGAGLSLGGFLFLQSSMLSLPNAVARWSTISYSVVAPFILAITVIFLASGVQSTSARLLRNPASRFIILGLLLAGLLVGYFTTGLISVFGLLLTHISSLLILLWILDEKGGDRDRSGLAVAIGMILFLLLNFLNAFAFTYPYTLPAMKGMGWAVYLVAGISLFFLTRTRGDLEPEGTLAFEGTGLIPFVVAVIVAIFAVWPLETADITAQETIRFGTYNIHYGYDDVWHYTLEDIATTIEETGCDFVAMQEVDTGRLTSYGVDNALYLARRLKMNVVYLSTVEHLTGIALLYRGTPAEVHSALISSLQEQTGIVQATIGEGGAKFHAFGIWLGLSNEDTDTQIAEALEFIGEQNPATFGGDFNADPLSEIATAIRGAGFSDPFEVLGVEPAPNTSPAVDPHNRIDFVWIRGFEAVDAWVPDSLASDHRMVVVEVKLLD